MLRMLSNKYLIIIIASVVGIFSISSIYGQEQKNYFVLEVENASTDPKITELNITGDKNEIYKSGNCKFEITKTLDQFSFNLPDMQDLSTISAGLIDMRIHDEINADLKPKMRQLVEDWYVDVTCKISDIIEEETNTEYKCEGSVQLFNKHTEDAWYYNIQGIYNENNNTLRFIGTYDGASVTN